MALGNNPTPNELVKEVRNIGSNYVPKTITEGTITTGINNNGDEGLVAGTANTDVSDTYSLMLKADNDDKSIRLESQTNSNIALVGVSTDGSAIMGVQDLSGSDSYTVISADLTNGVAVSGAAFTYNEENVLVESSLKTINNQSLVGSGNITIQGGSSGIVVVNSAATRIEVGEGAYLINIPVGNDEWALMVDKAFVQFNVDLSNIYSSITDNDIVYITHNLDLENLDVTGIISAFSNLDANSKAGMFLASEFENFGPGASWQFVGTITTIESDGDIYRSLYITSQVIPSGGGASTDVQVNGTSITSNNVANLITNTAYNASSNKIATMSDLPSVPVTGVQVNGTSILSSGVANLITQNADYDASTNKLITNSDLGGYLKKKTVLSGDSTIYNEIDASANYGGIILTSGDDYIEGNPATISAALIGPMYILSQVMDDSNNVSFSQITSSNGTENYASTTTENNQEIQSNLIIQKETTGISISDEVIVTDTTSNETTTYAGTLDFKPTELEIGVPTITPKVTNTTNLGSSYAKFKDLYLAGNLSDGTNTLTLAGIQPKSDSTLNTTSKTVVGAINEVNSIAKQANIAKSFASYSALITSLNSEASTTYKVGQSFYIETLEVPDLWVISVESSSSSYTYVDDATFVTATAASGGQQVGYYKLGQLETQKVDISTKMDKANPTGTGSLSLNRKANTTVGTNSVAVGNNTEASGTYSHAEGGSTTASGNTSHAEGYGTTASGNYSHTEGVDTQASGTSSHAQGQRTTANRRSQNVFGEYNVADVGGTDATTRGTYVEIVGNGTTNSSRSNARTLDWSGNEWLAGKITPAGGISDGKNADYKLVIPDTTSWTADKTIATTDQIPTVPTIPVTDVQLNGSSVLSGTVANVKALPNYSLSIGSTNGGNPRQVKFLSVNYTNYDGNNACFIKLGAMCSHGNGASYIFMDDIFIGVSSAGSVTCNVYKYFQQSVTLDGVTRNYGDVFYTIDTTNKVVDFYILLGQYSTANFTPYTKIGATTTTGITQYSGTPTYYSSGTKSWATGNSTTYARLSDIPTNTNQLTNGAGFLISSDLLSKVYPVGSVYMSVENTSPASFLGGTWSALSEGYALWTTTTANTGGATISAGLPNIKGLFNDNGHANNGSATGVSGAFYNSSDNNAKSNNGAASDGYQIGFDASRYNSIYKDSATTVQPPAIRVYAWKRTA